LLQHVDELAERAVLSHSRIVTRSRARSRHISFRSGKGGRFCTEYLLKLLANAMSTHHASRVGKM
jgi:hypothetical protein